MLARRKVLGGLVAAVAAAVGAGTVLRSSATAAASSGTLAGTLTDPAGNITDLAGPVDLTGTSGSVGISGTIQATPRSVAYAGEAVIAGLVRLTGDWTVDGLTVPAGSTLEFDPVSTATLRSRGNVVVEGVLRMGYGPAQHLLQFVDVDESRYVGGGMMVLDSDVGLWVMGAGRLDIEGQPKAGWNRTGTDPTWAAGDETWTAPNGAPANDAAHYRKFAPYTPGTPVPSVTSPLGAVYQTEVFNLTRTVHIQGQGDGTVKSAAAKRAHVFVHSTSPQHVRFAEFRHLGPRQQSTVDQYTVSLMGRYGLHFHHCDDGSRGSLVEGVVVRDCGAHAFVPHVSHGITFRDCVSFNTFDDAYWWDEGDRTDDVLYDRCAAFAPSFDPTFRSRICGFLAGLGTGNTMLDCVSVGVRGGKDSSGFQWPEFAAQEPDNVWTATGLVSHDQSGDGFFVWQNDANPHVIENVVAYNNTSAGIQHGAYTNAYAWRNATLFGNDEADLLLQALSATDHYLTFDGVDADRVLIRDHSQSRTNPVHVYGRFGSLTIKETPKTGTGVFVFHCDLTPAQVAGETVRSSITVAHSDGSSFVVPKTV